MLVLFGRTVGLPPKTRNRTGIANVFKRAMKRGERVTLEQAIAILKAGW